MLLSYFRVVAELETVVEDFLILRNLLKEIQSLSFQPRTVRAGLEADVAGATR